MFGWLHSRIRHPFYPNLRVTLAAQASGESHVLAGNFSELETAASRGARASHAVFILVADDGPLATTQQRERLWAWFHVPSFAIVLDGRGRVVAFECEAQDGFHLAGHAAAEDSPLCPCGRPGPRVSALRPTIARDGALPIPDRVSV